MTETVKLSCGHSREVPPILAEAARFFGVIACPICLAPRGLEDEDES